MGYRIQYGKKRSNVLPIDAKFRMRLAIDKGGSVADLGAGPGHSRHYHQWQARRGDQVQAAVCNARPRIAHQDCHSLCEVERAANANTNNYVQWLAAEFSGH